MNEKLPKKDKREFYNCHNKYTVLPQFSKYVFATTYIFTNEAKK